MFLIAGQLRVSPVSLALTQENRLLLLAMGEGFPLQKLFSLFHLQDVPCHVPFHSYSFGLPSAAPLGPWCRGAAGDAALQRRLRAAINHPLTLLLLMPKND